MKTRSRLVVLHGNALVSGGCISILWKIVTYLLLLLVCCSSSLQRLWFSGNYEQFCKIEYLALGQLFMLGDYFKPIF